MTLPRAALAAALALWSAPASAHWEYTVWGMSERQVVAASNGAARALPEDRRREVPEARMTYSAQAQLETPTLTLDVVFAFDNVTGGLVCVSFATRLRHQGPALLAWLTQRHGRPVQTGRDPATGEETATWREPDNIDFQMIPMRGAMVLQCARGT